MFGRLLINFVAGKEFMWRGFLYASIMFVTSELQTIFYHQSAIKVLEFGIKTKTSVISTIFRKVGAQSCEVFVGTILSL